MHRMTRTKAQYKALYAKLDAEHKARTKAYYEEMYRNAIFPETLDLAEKILLAIREYEDERR